MSTRVTATARMNTACQQLLRERLNVAYDATVELGNLNMLMDAERMSLASLQEVVGAEPVSMTLGALAPDMFQHARTMLADAETAADPMMLAASAQAVLTEALATADAAIAATTRDITAQAFAEAGEELGYAVVLCRGDVATGIELRREHEIMLLRVHDGGVVESDHAGLIDATCGDRQRELEQAAARRGITLANRQQHDHGNADGGPLIRVAAARRDAYLARATALDVGQLQPRPRVTARGRLAATGRAEERSRSRNRVRGAR